MTVVSDTSGKELFHITNKLISLRKTILGTDQSENRELFKVVKKISCRSCCHPRYEKHEIRRDAPRFARRTMRLDRVRA